MEIAALGISLPGLFDACLACFDLIDTGKRHGADHQKFLIAICSLELRLSRWRDLARLTDSSTQLTKEETEHIRELLGQIQADLEDAQETSKRYNPSLPDEGSEQMESLAERFRRRAHARQRRTPVVKEIRWALRDKKKCDRLVEDIEDGIAALELELPHIGPSSQLAHKAAVEDAEQLIKPAATEEPAEAKVEEDIKILQGSTVVDPLLQKVIEIVAKKATSGDEIRNIFTSDYARLELDDFIASDYAGPPPGERAQRRVIENIKTSGEGRVRIGRTYGGKGVFD